MSGKGSGRRPEAEAGAYAAGWDAIKWGDGFAALTEASMAMAAQLEQESQAEQDVETEDDP